MTVNALMAFILRYFAEFGSFLAHHVKVIKGTPILSAIEM